MKFTTLFLTTFLTATSAYAGPSDVKPDGNAASSSVESIAPKEEYTHRFMFGDTIKDDADASAFRDKLAKIVKDKDTDALLAIMDDNIKLSFGAPKLNNREELKQALQLDKNPKKSPIWEEFERMLPQGGTLQKDTIMMPYQYAYEFPESDWTQHEKGVDPIFESFVTTQATPLFKDKNKDSALLRMLMPYETLVLVIDKDDNCETYRTFDGLKGCVDPAHVRSPIDYRAIFKKTDGEWKMISFLAGD